MILRLLCSGTWIAISDRSIRLAANPCPFRSIPGPTEKHYLRRGPESVAVGHRRSTSSRWRPGCNLNPALRMSFDPDLMHAQVRPR